MGGAAGFYRSDHALPGGGGGPAGCRMRMLRLNARAPFRR